MESSPHKIPSSRLDSAVCRPRLVDIPSGGRGDDGVSGQQSLRLRTRNPHSRRLFRHLIATALLAEITAVLWLSVILPAPAGASTPDFLAAARAAGVTGADPAMLEDGYDVCWQLWNQHASGVHVAGRLVRDHPGLTSDEAGQFVLAAYNDLCPVPGAYDYWAYSTG